jgi:hypothetical protein
MPDSVSTPLRSLSARTRPALESWAVRSCLASSMSSSSSPGRGVDGVHIGQPAAQHLDLQRAVLLAGAQRIQPGAHLAVLLPAAPMGLQKL